VTGSDQAGRDAPSTVNGPHPRAQNKEVQMDTRYLTNVLLVLGGGFVIVATQAFSAATAAWLAFAVTGVGAAALTGLSLMRGRGPIQRTMDAVIAAFAAWTIVESLVFTGTVGNWLSFGAAAAIAALSVAGLTVHELVTERVVHAIDIPRGARATDRAAAPAA
jgi:hypothetical protein